MKGEIDRKIIEKINLETNYVPDRLNEKLQETFASLPDKRKNKRRSYLVISAVAAIFLSIFVYNNANSLAEEIPIIASLQELLGINDKYTELVDDSELTQASNGITVKITQTVFDGYELMLAYEVHSEKSFTEEPFIIPNGSITSGNLELNASASNEEGTFTDKQKKHYQGVAIFYLNKGSFQDLGSSNSEYAYGETALKGQQIDLQAIPERFTLGFHLDNLGSEEVMKGNWNFSIPIESEKAKGNVKEVSIDEDLAGIGAKIGVEKLIITPIRTYLQSKMTDENSYIDYLISDDKGNVLRYVGGSVQGHYIGEERLISYYETNSTAINWYSIIPYEYSKTRGEGITLNKTGETLLPIDKNEFLTITKTVVENGKTYMYYQSDVPVSNYLPFTLIDETGFEYMRDLEESKMEQGKVSFLVFDGDLLNKKLKVYNPNTYYYDKEFTVNIQ